MPSDYRNWHYAENWSINYYNVDTRKAICQFIVENLGNFLPKKAVRGFDPKKFKKHVLAVFYAIFMKHSKEHSREGNNKIYDLPYNFKLPYVSESSFYDPFFTQYRFYMLAFRRGDIYERAEKWLKMDAASVLYSEDSYGKVEAYLETNRYKPTKSSIQKQEEGSATTG